MTLQAPPQLKQFRITVPAEGYWRITFDNPPINLMDGETARELLQIVEAIESAADLRVVVLDSAHADFFVARYDFRSEPSTPGTTGLPLFLDITVRLSQAPVVSIASIRGRTRGGGNELALACDLRFASTEKALFCQPEIGTGLIPGGGGIERLSALVGRARALEIILSGDDFDARTAELYGWINRALPDDRLDAYVDALARRIASFGTAALRATKRMVNRHTLPNPQDLVESQTATLALMQDPQFQERFRRIGEIARTAGSDFDLRMGHHMGSV